jgi:hypothetical protein
MPLNFWLAGWLAGMVTRIACVFILVFTRFIVAHFRNTGPGGDNALVRLLNWVGGDRPPTSADISSAHSEMRETKTERE